MISEFKKQEIRPKLVGIGHGGFDLEAIIRNVENNHIKINNNTIEFPRYVCVSCGGKNYFGEIDAELIDGKVILDLSKGKKKDLKEFDGKYLHQIDNIDEFMREREISGYVLQINADMYLGQGALNAITQSCVFGREVHENKINFFLTCLCKDEEIRRKLPEQLRKNYDGVSEGEVLKNINLTLALEGTEITLRSKLKNHKGNYASKNLENLTENDVVFLDSVKDVNYFNYVVSIIGKTKEINGEMPHVYFFPTDSMIKVFEEKDQKDKLLNFLEECEVYCSKVDELASLVGREIDVENVDSLYEAMREVQSKMKKGARVYVTNNSKGSYVLDENWNLLYHPVAKNDLPKYPNGCGDAFAGVVACLELMASNRKFNEFNGTTKNILRTASIAGQINATLKSASSVVEFLLSSGCSLSSVTFTSSIKSLGSTSFMKL